MPDSPAGATRSGGSSQPGPKRKKEETLPRRFLPASRLDWKPLNARRSPPANRRRGWKGDPLVVSVKPGYGAWSSAGPPDVSGPRAGRTALPPNLSGQYTRWGNVVKKKTPREHKIFDSACPKYLSVVVRFRLVPRVLEPCGLTEKRKSLMAFTSQRRAAALTRREAAPTMIRSSRNDDETP